MGHQKKLPRLQAALQKLRARIVAHGIAGETADQIAEDLLSFANYGFPESHAWSFALIAYATAYLKAHYPAEFFMALLNAWPMGFYPPATLVHTARREGVEVRPPCLRDGEWECTLEPGALPSPSGTPALRIGWRFVRGLGEAAREALQAARAEAPFRSVEDVVRRVRLTRGEVLQLARAGAFEAFEPGRRRAAWEALRSVGDHLPLAPMREGPLPFDPRELAGQELIFLDYLATGISTAGHPVEHLRDRLEDAGVTGSRGLESLRDGERCVVAGLVVARQHPATSKGTVFILLEDEDGFVNVIVPPRLYLENREIVNHSPFLQIEGRFERDGRVLNVVGARFRRLEAGAIVYRSRDFQ
jgi:error-prone DNA polymerase